MEKWHSHCIHATTPLKLQMSLCHRSQVLEWLPLVNGEENITEEIWMERFLYSQKSIVIDRRR